jgi:hypothetical protein
MKRAVLALGSLSLLAVTACSVSPSSTRTTESPTARETMPSSTPTPGGATAESSPGGGATPGNVTPASSCLSGTYRLARFAAAGELASFGRGEGGDVTIAFGPGTYQLTGAGKDPITLTLAGQQGSLLVSGTIRGDYRAEGDRADFTIQRATGSGTLSGLGQSRTLTMDDVGNVVGLSGSATVGCSSKLLVITRDVVRLELEKA